MNSSDSTEYDEGLFIDDALATVYDIVIKVKMECEMSLVINELEDL